MLTPEPVHHGRHAAVIEQRQHLLNSAFEKYAERFVHGAAKHKSLPEQIIPTTDPNEVLIS